MFFDHSRLSDWDILSKPFGYVQEQIEEEPMHTYMNDADRTEMDRIWELGGRGWWRRGDESKLVWPFKDEN